MDKSITLNPIATHLTRKALATEVSVHPKTTPAATVAIIVRQELNLLKAIYLLWVVAFRSYK